MHPVAWRLLRKTRRGVGGDSERHGGAAWLLLLLLLSLGVPPPAASCPSFCLCASDIVSCSGRNLTASPPDIPRCTTRLDLSHNWLTALPAGWSSEPMDHLLSLVLSWNSIRQIDPDAFAVSTRLLNLDLSSNQLTVLNSSAFRGLERLQVLLLFGNQIAQLKPGTFRNLQSLQMLYLSGNRLDTFPMELYTGQEGPRNLTFLDLSSNRVSHVPVQDLLSLPAQQQAGIYLQGNPLTCDYALLAMLEYWLWKQWRPMVDFKDEYPCRLGAEPLQPGLAWSSSWQALMAPTYKAEPGDWLQVPCPGFPSQAQGKQTLFWLTPAGVLNSSTDGPKQRFFIFPDGTLEIQGVLLPDSGMYACVTPRGPSHDPKKSLEIRLLVGNATFAFVSDSTGMAGVKQFNTAFTTLASCVISIVLVLLYLYLTPCRCGRCRGPGCGAPSCGGCSGGGGTESQSGQANGKRVAFLEPQPEDSQTNVPKSPKIHFGHVATEGILKNGSRTVGQTVTDAGGVV